MIDFHLAFEHFAAGRDNDVVDEEQFHLGLKKLKWNLTKAEVSRLMEKFGSNGRINYRQFLRALAPSSAEKQYDNDIAARVRGAFKRTVKRKNDLVRVFQRSDRDNTGKIGAKGLRHALKEVNIELSASECTNLVNKFDKNGDGEISYAEFVDFLEGRSASSAERGKLLSSSVVQEYHIRTFPCPSASRLENGLWYPLCRRMHPRV